MARPGSVRERRIFDRPGRTDNLQALDRAGPSLRPACDVEILHFVQNDNHGSIHCTKLNRFDDKKEPGLAFHGDWASSGFCYESPSVSDSQDGGLPAHSFLSHRQSLFQGRGGGHESALELFLHA